MKKLFVIIILCTVSHAALSEPNMEIKNKGSKIWVKVKNGLTFLKDKRADAKSVYTIEKDQTLDLRIASPKETRLYIYSSPDASELLKEYVFAKNKTIYVTWNGELLYPQTGYWKGMFGKTDSGYSLANNVIVDSKKSIDINRVDRPDPEMAADRVIREAARKSDKSISLNKLWKEWCDPSEKKPERPDSLLCAAGYGNGFALLILRLRFIVPTNAENRPDPSQHLFLKMIPENLPKAEKPEELDPQALFRGFFLKLEKNEVLTWKDFNAFIKPVKLNPVLAKFLSGLLSDYGLSTEESRTEKELKTRAADLKSKALAALNDPNLHFPVVNIGNSADERMDLDTLYASKCKGKAPWKASLFCAMGDGNVSAQFLGQVGFVKPKKKEQHPISQMLAKIEEWANSTSIDFWERLTKKITKKAVSVQLKKAIDVVERNESSLTWEELRDILVVWVNATHGHFISKNLVEWVPYFGNSFIKAYGLEIAE